MKFRVVHRTRYEYSQPVVLCHNEARLQPRATARQYCTRSELRIEPFPAEREEREDFFGNRVLYFAIQDPHDSLVVTSQMLAGRDLSAEQQQISGITEGTMVRSMYRM